MRGCDLTPEQLAAAEQFLETIHHGSIEELRGNDISIPFEQYVRVLAWYGAIRAMAVANGTGTVEAPEKCVVVGVGSA